MSEDQMPMRIKKKGSWFLPALLAPWFSMTALVTALVAVQFIFNEPNPKFGPWASWVLGMQVGSLASGLISLALIAVDLVRVKRGTLPPVGISAWAGGVLSFVVALGLYVIFLPVIDDGFLFGEALDLCIMVLGSIAVGAISARLVLFRWANSG
jgi:hypothetical protein